MEEYGRSQAFLIGRFSGLWTFKNETWRKLQQVISRLFVILTLAIGFAGAAQAQSANPRTEIEDGTTVQTFFDANQIMIKQVRTSNVGGTVVVRTIDSTGAIVEISRTSDQPVADDPTVVNDDPSIRIRKVSIKRYMRGSRVPIETVVLEEKTKLMATTDRLTIERKIITTTYSPTKPRTVVKKVDEQGRFVKVDDNGIPIFEGRRVTTEPGREVIEAIGRETQRWEIVPSQDEPAPETDTSDADNSFQPKPSDSFPTYAASQQSGEFFCEPEPVNYSSMIAQLREHAGQALVREFTK